jgi:hypothetical protein
VTVGALAAVPRAGAADLLKLAPGVLLTNDGSEGHAQQIFLRGFDARQGQDLELTVDGVPINEVGNLHGNGYSDTNFILPELIRGLRVVEGAYDPRQGNFAVAGSADFELGLARRGASVKYSTGSFGTHRLLFTWGPSESTEGTFTAAELYQTNGFGQNRDGRRATMMAQYEGRIGDRHSYRVTAQAQLASFNSPTPLRDDDYRAGRVGFFDTYDFGPSIAAQRYSVAASLDSRLPSVRLRNQLYVIARPMTLRENYTGFLLDTQEPQQNPHDQRGDLYELRHLGWSVGAKGSGRVLRPLFGQLQGLELGYFARADFTDGTQSRINAASGNPYTLETSLEARLGDIGLYADVDLHPGVSWITLRGGLRADLFLFDVLDRCAVKSVRRPPASNPPGDDSCLSQEQFGAYREPTQGARATGLSWMPRGSLLVGPWRGLTATFSAGMGARSIDPIYVVNSTQTPFASALSYEGGLTFDRDLGTLHLNARSVGFQTRVDKDLIFSETVGRNLLGGATTRTGSATALRLTGRFFDVSANVTYVRALFQDTGLLIPYIPDLVVRADLALFGDVPLRRLRPAGRPIFAALGTGITYVAPRPLPQGERGNTLFTVDASASLRWWFVELGLQATNLFDARYRLSEYNYASNWRSEPFPTLTPVRHFIAGPPLTAMFFVALHTGGRP